MPDAEEEIHLDVHTEDYPLPPPQHLMEIRSQLRNQMAERGLDALVAISAENFYYVVGCPSSLSYLLPLAGNAALAVLWARESDGVTVAINDFEGSTFPDEALGVELVRTPHWTGVPDERSGSGNGESPSASREPPPSTLDSGETFRALGRFLRRLGPQARVGMDAVHLPPGARPALLEALGSRELVDATDVFDVGRSHKTEWEIGLLTEACRISEDAIVASSALIAEGVTERQLKTRHDGYITGSPEGAGIRLSGISIGSTFSIRAFPSTRPGRRGELVRYDCGAHVMEYGADIARVFAIGAAGAAAQRAHDTLRIAHDELVAGLGPGVKGAAVYEAAMSAIRSGGLPQYRRGHIGHSVGLTRAVEEPPILGPNCSAELRPGMVLSIETPYYTTEIGAINIEDMVVITPDGCRVLNRLTKDLVVK